MLEGITYPIAAAILRLPGPILSLLAGRAVVVDGHRLDPQVQLLLKLMALARIPPLDQLSPAAAREVYRKGGPFLDARPIEMERIDDRKVPGPGGEIPIRIYVPKARPAPAPLLVYFHGGGWVIGDLETHDPPCRLLADRIGCIVAAVDYRLAPEHRFPAAAEDAFAAYRWVSENAAALGGDPKRIAVAGDSAGGTLSTVVCLTAKRERIQMPILQVLIYPATDLATEHPSWEKYKDGFFLTRDMMRWFRGHYLARPEDGSDTRASPLRADDLAGLPPAHVLVAGFDPLREEGEEYAERLKAAGVSVTLRKHPSLIHGWISMTGVIGEAAKAFDEMVSVLRGAFERVPSAGSTA